MNFKRLFAVLVMSTAISAAFAKYPKHSIMPMVGLASTGISDYSLRLSNGLQVSYASGDRLRTPLGIRYQYRMKKGNILGADVLSVFNSLSILPQYPDATSQLSGPIMALGGDMMGANIHYSKTIDIKMIEIFAMAGFGGYFMGNRSNNLTTDYSWYKNADPGFYDFAPVVTNNVLKKFMPVVDLGFGIRFKHMEAGLHNQISLSSPVKDFTYNGQSHSVPLSWKSIWFYVGYRFEF
jgi:hypothetical protein